MSVEFTQSQNMTLGMELELQLIDPNTFDLGTTAPELMQAISESQFQENIKPEITQSMIEIISGIHATPQLLYKEMAELCQFVTLKANQLNTLICGGGSHPFQLWSSRKIFPSDRFRKKSIEQGYLAKQFTVFGMHVHVGCPSADDALYLTHILSRYLPQLIALSASSPFYQGVPTGFHSTRCTLGNSFFTSGMMPSYITNWDNFSEYFNKMKMIGIIQSMKDVYWDVRPKPEFGTVEVRICDTPLTLSKAIMIGAYIQTLAKYILSEKSFFITKELYMVYPYNRFQAARFGYNGDFINPFNSVHKTLFEDILETLNIIKPYATSMGNLEYIVQINEMVLNKQSDAIQLWDIYSNVDSLESLVHEQCNIWMGNLQK